MPQEHDDGSVLMAVEDREVVSTGRTITDADILSFAGFSGDFAPLHMDEQFAGESTFGTRIMHGVGTFAICSGLIWQLGVIGPPYFAFVGSSFRLSNPVLVGDTIRVTIRIQYVRATSNGTNEVVTFMVRGLNQRDDEVLTCEWRVLRPVDS